MYNPFTIENKDILVTGASSGIGKAIAIQAAKMGANVTITARNKERLTSTLEQMENPQYHTMILADLSIEEDVENLIKKIPSKLDGIVQCAGLTLPKPFHFITKENLSTVMNVNFEAPVYLTQQLFKKKLISQAASVVFISSIAGVYISDVGNSLYAASKGAINGIVKGMALEFAVKKIRVNCVNPGMVDTNILEAGIISQEQLEEHTQKYPLKRFGKPEDIAYAVIYLLSDASCWVTGSNLVIDGGYTLL